MPNNLPWIAIQLYELVIGHWIIGKGYRVFWCFGHNILIILKQHWNMKNILALLLMWAVYKKNYTHVKLKSILNQLIFFWIFIICILQLVFKSDKPLHTVTSISPNSGDYTVPKKVNVPENDIIYKLYLRLPQWYLMVSKVCETLWTF